jgi:hypothetical protein
VPLGAILPPLSTRDLRGGENSGLHWAKKIYIYQDVANFLENSDSCFTLGSLCAENFRLHHRDTSNPTLL